MVSEKVAEVRALPTKYNGHLFRSRLEARWAVFFDELNTPWRYESQGMHFPAGVYSHDESDMSGSTITLDRDWNYLPDFYLPELNSWFEVKGVNPSDDYRSMLHVTEWETNRIVILAVGEIPQFTADDEPMWDIWDFVTGPNVLWDNGYQFCRCPKCKRLGFTFEARSGRVCGRTHEGNGDYYRWDVSPDILAAYRKARSYRFWDAV